MGKLKEQREGDLELKVLSAITQEIYLGRVKQFSRHHGRSIGKTQLIDIGKVVKKLEFR